MKAMILAAGFGTRLFPLTIDRTKPAIPFFGKPLVGYVAEYIAKFGFDDVVVNLHHQPESVKKALGDGSAFGTQIHYTYEKPKILGTAGALDNAREHLEGDTFLVINGKIITDIDIDAALDTHKESGALATMVLMRNDAREHFTEVYVEDGRISGFGDFADPELNGKEAPYMFTGIHIFEPRVFEYIPRGVYSDIVPTFYNPAIRKGETIAAHVTDGRWYELSTIRRYLDISLAMLNGNKDRLVLGRNNLIDSSASVEESVIWDDVTIGPNARVYRSVIGDGVKVREGARYENVAVVTGEMLSHCEGIPQKALKGEFDGENYVVRLTN
ncbi:MAG: NDP-sugar synthase [Acidobacteriota bacterium]|nr:NDP-sugar synthase [Acidobacteriota bacterium]MDH3528650.1 NDP-sugar synthase [Acidobacteriota bacterium]